MTDISILTTDIRSYKTRAFLFPILRYQSELNLRGFNIDLILNNPDKVEPSDVLMICDQVYTQGNAERDLIKDLQKFNKHFDKVFWFDTGDGTTVQTYGCFSPSVQTSILPNVDRYYKKQLLADRDRYTQTMYGSRLFTDYYNRETELCDDFYDNPTDERVQVEDDTDLRKLGLYWNLYQNMYLPYIGSDLYSGLFRSFKLSPKIIKTIPWDAILRLPPVWASPDRRRPTSISGRYSTSFRSKSIEYHRQLMTETLGSRVDSTKVSTSAYWKELRQAKLLLSPFGWGELCHRDFEGFLSGCVVVKPRMDHLETWPALYEDGETVLTVEWNMNDLEKTVESALENYRQSEEIARRGQKRYQNHLLGETGMNKFVERFEQIVNY